MTEPGCSCKIEILCEIIDRRRQKLVEKERILSFYSYTLMVVIHSRIGVLRLVEELLSVYRPVMAG